MRDCRVSTERSCGRGLVIKPVTRATALRRRSWLDLGVRLPVAINVSARSLLDQRFASNIAARLAEHDLPPELLWIELTEGTIMSDPDRAISILRELRTIGVRLSVDEFGTGYSSMAYLKILPVDELKIDRSFVKGMTSDNSDAVLVQSANDLGYAGRGEEISDQLLVKADAAMCQAERKGRGAPDVPNDSRKLASCSRQAVG